MYLPFAEKTTVSAPLWLLIHPTPSLKQIESKYWHFWTFWNKLGQNYFISALTCEKLTDTIHLIPPACFWVIKWTYSLKWYKWFWKCKQPTFGIGHRELITYPIDPYGETLVCFCLFCISQHMPWIQAKTWIRGKKGKTRSFFNYCMLCNGCHILENPILVQIRSHYFYF